MSVPDPPKRRVVLAPAARADLRDILRYTSRQWGARQRAIYKQALFQGFDRLARHPFIGKAQQEYGKDALSFPIGQHLIIYAVTETELLISRVIHQRRDISSELGV